MSNINNRTVYCKDNLDILKGIDSQTVDMIYLDPPFNKKKSFHAPIGSSSEGASFKDTWFKEDVKTEWLTDIRLEQPELHAYLGNVAHFAETSDFNYLTYMAVRILECHRVLKDTGSLFYHCDDTMQHYIKLMLDIIFGRNNFKNELNWNRTSMHNDGNRFGRVTDAILFYSKSNNYTFNPVYISRDISYYPKIEIGTNRRYRLNRIDGPGKRSSRMFNGIEIFSNDGRQFWSQGKIDEALKINKIEISSNGKPYQKYYADEDKGLMIQDLWIDIKTQSMTKNEVIGYPTQKPLALMNRIIKCSTNEGDMVLDPFMGGGTTCVAAEHLNRQWIGIDVSMEAYTIVKQRLIKDVQGQVDGQTDAFGSQITITATTTSPVRNHIDLPDPKWIYVIKNDAWKGKYKVGIAKNWKSRLNSYQTSSPDRNYTIEYKVKTPHYKFVEKFVHDSFPGTHEWVEAEPLQIVIDKINEGIKLIENN